MDQELSNINEEQLYADISQLIEVTQQRVLNEISRGGALEMNCKHALLFLIRRQINLVALRFS